jgi:carboxylate-amine ligase
MALSGVPSIFESHAEYKALVEALVATKSVEEVTKIYWDVQLSERFPTIEFRRDSPLTRVKIKVE